MPDGWTIDAPAAAPAAPGGWTLDGPKSAPAPKAAPAPKPAGGWSVSPAPAAAAAPKPAPAPAAKPAPAQRKAPGYNPGTEYRQDLDARHKAAKDQFGEGMHQFAPGDGQSADPINAVSGAWKMMGAGWSLMTAPIDAAMDTAVGKPVESLTGTKKTFAGDASNNALGFLIDSPNGPTPRVPRMTEEARAHEMAAREAERAAPPKPAKPGKVAKVTKPAAADPAAGWKIEPPPAAAPAKGKKAPAMPQTMAAAREAGRVVPGDELFAPEPHEHGAGPVVGDEQNHVQRVDNALYRLQGHATADKLDAQQFMRALPKEVKDPALQEDLYHAIEAKLADPNAQIPEHLAPAMEAMRPWYEEQTDIANRLRERGLSDKELDDLELYDHDQGYVARRAQGHTPLMDDPFIGDKPRDPIMGGRSLFKSTNATKARTAGFMATDADGATHFYKGKVPDTDIMDRPFQSVRQATTKEIEGNTDVRYHKNALVNTVDNVVRLRRVERNLQVLDELTAGLKEQGLAHQNEWHYKNGQGQWVRAQANKRPPEGFVELHHIPQLKGWFFDPKVANVLKDYHPEPGKSVDSVLQKVNRMLTASLFITPIPHAANVMTHWAVGRGWDWINPVGYARLMRTGTEAAKQVLTMGPKYKQMLREGSALLYGDTNTKAFHEQLLGKAAREVTGDPKALATLSKAAGVPATVVKAAYGAANKMLWAIGDIFMLQRQMELEAKGMSTRKAIAEAERDIPNYRIPPEVLKSRWVSEVMRDPKYLMFGRYKYGQLKAWGEMFRDLGNFKDTHAQVDALGKLLAALTISQVVYPLMDQAVKGMTGNENAKVHRAGPFSLTDSAWQAATGQKEFATALSSFITPAPLASEGVDLMQNHDFFGRPIRTEGAPLPLQAAETGKYVGENAFYPLSLASEAARGGGSAALGRLSGLELPTDEQVASREKFAAKRKAAGAKAWGRFTGRLEDGDYLDAYEKMGRKR